MVNNQSLKLLRRLAYFFGERVLEFPKRGGATNP